MLSYESKQRSLNKEDKQAIGLISIGTFLEHFDLFIYIHMAVLLNELFFPPSNDFAFSINSAIAFCSMYIFAPLSAIVFGWIGDNIGRKSTVVITTMMMAISCFAMANLSTFAQIGITASWIMSICRVIQGISCSSELIGAEIYLSEITKPPLQYPVVAMVGCFGVLGIVTALGVASIFTSYGFNWRIVFWVGASIALVGSVARTKLRETPEFADAKRRVKNQIERMNISTESLKENIMFKEKTSVVPAIFYFLVQCGWPVCTYFGYIHCGNILKQQFGFTAEQVIHQNFQVSLVHLSTMLILAFLSYKIYPLKILKTVITIFCVFTLLCPYLLNNISTPFHLFLIQSFVMIFGPKSDYPAGPIFFRNFPVFKRFTYANVAFAFSRAVMYAITSFGVIYLIKYFGNYGLLFIMLPVIIGYISGLYYFEKLEKKEERYDQKELYLAEIF
ncbi:MAG: MFS transporter [Rickettsia endosymbiont of Oxypoda opaca]|nr:MFS transporter [Rickettsia endosymbiont of Oxypoda opaca]